MDTLHTFAFCPRCGSKFTTKNKDYLGCSSCGLHYYASPKPCAGILPINKDGAMLLVERALEPRKGKWDVLGGFLKDGETLEEGARREAHEELGVAFKDLSYLASYAHGYIYQGIEYALVVALFTARLDDSAYLKAVDDIAAYKFFKLEDVTVDMLAFPELRPLLRV